MAACSCTIIGLYFGKILISKLYLDILCAPVGDNFRKVQFPRDFEVIKSFSILRCQRCLLLLLKKIVFPTIFQPSKAHDPLWCHVFSGSWVFSHSFFQTIGKSTKKRSNWLNVLLLWEKNQLFNWPFTQREVWLDVAVLAVKALEWTYYWLIKTPHAVFLFSCKTSAVLFKISVFLYCKHKWQNIELFLEQWWSDVIVTDAALEATIHFQC